MNKFAEILRDLIDERGIDVKTLAGVLGQQDLSIMYKWLNGRVGISLATAVKIADYFECSLDYLFGRIEEYSKCEFKGHKPFDEQFRAVLKEQKLSQYRLIKDGIISGGNIDNWLNKKNNPTIESLTRLATYLNTSLDYIAGRTTTKITPT